MTFSEAMERVAQVFEGIGALILLALIWLVILSRFVLYRG